MKYILFVLAALVTTSCQYDLNKDGVSTGKLKIGIDDSYSLMMQSQIFTFEKIYAHAKVFPTYEPEADVIQALLDDSIQAAIVSRPLTEAEVAMFNSKQRFPESLKIATDGIAFIVNPENPDSVFTMDQLQQVFSGDLVKWSDVHSTSNLSEIKVVFDNNKSCNARSIKEKFLGDKAFPANCFAVNSNEEVINFVNTNKNAMGVISVSWLSDPEDSTTRSFMKRVKLVGLIDPANKVDPEMPRKPYQAYIYDQTYPLRRDVWAIRTGLKATLGTGFVSHLAGEKGQLIIHKMGMVAATAPVRAIKITE